MKYKEWLAREICRQSGYDPDSAVTQQMLVQGPFGSQVLPDTQYQVPAWVLYKDIAGLAISTLNRASISIEE